MSRSSFDPQRTPEGKVIPAHMARVLSLTIQTLLMLGAIVAACAFLFYERMQAGRFNVTAALLGIAAAFGMLYVFPVYLFRHVGRRIVVGADCLQIINFSGAVVTQIPYRNIGRMETFGWLFPILGIDVT